MSLEALNDLNWLAQTKFMAPLPGPNLVSRPRLAGALSLACQQHRLTLISAPAGFGKTTLLAEAFFWNSPPNLPKFAWIGLDEEDNDPVYFLGGLVSALRRLNPRFGAAAQLQLANLANPETEGKRFCSLLINEIMEHLPEPFGLVLDDLHWITNPAVYRLLDYWLERMPPQMRLVIASRYDPNLNLSRLRARGQLAEIRFDQLRFTAEEMGGLLHERLGQPVAEAEMQSLLRQTGGWAAALQMLANSLPSFPATAPAQNPLSEVSLPPLLQTRRNLFEYLAEEVLNRQDLVERTFLLETSILSEPTPELCEAVSGRADSAAILERLYRRNLFLTLVDSRGPTYRYHDLFAEFLQHRLETEMPEAVAVLHKCAAHAYSETQPWQAIRHLLAGQLWEEAADAIEEAGETLLRQGTLGALQNWIEALPANVSEAHPRLNYFRGVCALRQGRLEEARRNLEKALEDYEVNGRELELGEILLQLAGCDVFGGNFGRAEQYLNRALTLSLPPKTRFLLLSNRSYLNGIRHDWQQFGQDERELLELTLQSSDPELFWIKAFYSHTIVVLVPGLLEPFERYAQVALARFKDKDSFIESNALAFLSYLDLLQGRLESSIEKLERFKAVARPSDLEGLHYADLALLEIEYRQWQGRYEEIDLMCQDLVAELEQIEVSRPWLGLFVTLWASARYHLGHLEKLREVYAVMLRMAYPQERPEAEIGRRLARALLEMGEQRYAAAEQTLKTVIELQSASYFSQAATLGQLLLAELYRLWNRPKLALEQLSIVLSRCEAENLPGLILREGPAFAPLLKLAYENEVNPAYVARLLQLLGVPLEARPQSLKIPGTGETLSAREIEVLHLLIARATNREIAEKLVISEATVKTHVARILQKLEVESRTEVANRARQLGLIP